MPTIILDRDGVINYDSFEYIKTPAEWIAIPGSLEAIAKLNQHDYQVFVASNQSGIARNLYTETTLQLIHQKMLSELAAVGGNITKIYYCPHHPELNCRCRKPNPGLIEQIAAEYPIDIKKTYFVGDKETDMQLAQHTGMTPILVLTEMGQRALKKNPDLIQFLHFNDLSLAVDYILKNPL